MKKLKLNQIILMRERRLKTKFKEYRNKLTLLKTTSLIQNLKKDSEKEMQVSLIKSLHDMNKSQNISTMSIKAVSLNQMHLIQILYGQIGFQSSLMIQKRQHEPKRTNKNFFVVQQTQLLFILNLDQIEMRKRFKSVILLTSNLRCLL